MQMAIIDNSSNKDDCFYPLEESNQQTETTTIEVTVSDSDTNSD